MVMVLFMSMRFIISHFQYWEVVHAQPTSHILQDHKVHYKFVVPQGPLQICSGRIKLAFTFPM